MRGKAIAAACIAVILTAGTAAAQTPPPCGSPAPSAPRPQVSQDGLTWEVRYLIDTSSCPGGKSQIDSPRSNRGVGVSPDGRFLYLGYNEPNGALPAVGHDHQVRMIDTTIEDFEDSIVTILGRHRGKSITVDDRGRVYLAEGSDTDVHLGAGGIHILDATLSTEVGYIARNTMGLVKPEGVTVKREAGVLVLYVTDRTTQKLNRFVITEGSGATITAMTKTGLYTGTGEVVIPGAVDLRGVKIESTGRIWMADLTGNKVIRCESDASACLATPVTKPMDIGLLGARAFVTQFTSPVPPTITVLRQSDMGFDSLLVPPWSSLKLDPLGQRAPVVNGAALGNFSGTAFVRLPNGDKALYFANERGQTEFEKSTYGRCDEYSDNPGGACHYTDITADDNEPTFKIVEPNRTIGDFVWIDVNGNGIQDAGEVGLANVTVTLDGPLGSQTTTTDANGFYLFSDLAEGAYTVTVATPAGYTPSPILATGSTTSNDSNASPATVALTGTTTSDLTIDFGFVPPATGTIGDFVWTDVNANGIQDAGEPGIAGVSVSISGPNGYSATTTTNTSGFYQFTNLAAGTYTVTVATPAGLAPTQTGQGTTATDSNGSPATVTLATNSSSDQTIDFGFKGTGSIGDFVWTDVNGNGIQDAGEPGIAGVSVSISGPNGYTATTTTDGSGLYQFTNLAAGTYTVTVATPAGLAPTLTGQGTTATDSNGSPATVTLLTNGSSDQTIDFGFRGTGSVGDFVWTDVNGNGVQDAGEPGIAGVSVSISGPNGYSATTTTDGSGLYQFTNLAAGTYTVTVATPAGLTPTQTGQGTAATDSNGSPATVTLLTNGSSDQTIDFGFRGTGSIGDFVWIDVNGNGIQDAGEPGIAGVSVSISGPNGYSATTTTDGSGLYQFTNLAAGTYTVTVTTPAGLTPTLTGQGTTATDSNGSPATVTLATNSSSDQTIDFGFKGTGSIGDFVWTDVNANGIQDAGEPGIAGVNVSISGSNGYSATTTTNASGFYQFIGLAAGTYTVTVTTPAGLTPTQTGQGTTATDSNGSPATVTLATNSSSDQTIDFGFKGTGSIGDFVWTDVNGNGIQDAGEPGIAGVSVSISGPNGYSATTTTDGSGLYQFTNLAAGTYAVTVMTPAGLTPTLTGQGTTATDSNGSPAMVTLATNSSSDQTIDFGFKGTGSIGDFVWTDVNGNGIQDAGEPGIAGVSVSISGPNGYSATTTTNASGFYQFIGLAAGTYTVTVTTPAGLTPTLTGQGTTATDSNGSPATVTLASNSSSDQTIDFGFKGTGTIGDFVWTDVNGNGIQDAGEPGIAGVGVSISGPNGYSATTTTNASGFYQFIGLAAGTYTVTVSTPAGFSPTTSSAAGSTAANDSNGSPATVTLPTNGSTDTTIDFGFVTPLGTIGDFVWNDLNGNGIQDAGEPGFANVTVQLKNSSGVIIQTTTTTASGFYQFTNLFAGNYTVIVATPAGYVASPSLAPGSTTANDSNGSPATVTLTTNSSTNLTIDFGYVLISAGRIGDFVWNDLNANGIQNSGEPGLANVTVQLKDSTGTVIRTTTTDASGFYQFTLLAAGSYTVVVGTPSGFTATISSAPGSTTANDSNGSPAAVTLPTSTSVDLTIDFGFVKSATGYTTYTQGGWGTVPHGNNPGVLLMNNFLKVYPGGSVTIGGTRTLTFTSQRAIEAFLPQGSTPGVLNASAINPVGSAAGVFAGQVLSLRLSVDFSAAGITKVGLGGLRVTAGPLAGYTVNQVLTLANRVLGGTTSALPAGVTISTLNGVVDAINNNFDNGTTNNGYLQ